MKRLKTPADVGLREVLYEFRQVGKHLRIVAIDPDTGTEVTMIGDRKASMTELKRHAMRKLIYVMDKKGFTGRGRRRRPGELDELA
jgi:hypothetical protein